MALQKNPRIIALEEHYWDQEVAATYRSPAGRQRPPGIAERLYDYGELRIKEMDEAASPCKCCLMLRRLPSGWMPTPR